MENGSKDINEIKRNFINIKNEYRPIPILHLDADLTDQEHLSACLSALKKNGYGGAALASDSNTIPPANTAAYYESVCAIMEKAKKSSFSILLCDDINCETGHLAGTLKASAPAAAARVLQRREYACTKGERSEFRLVSRPAGEDLTQPLPDGRLVSSYTMAVVAFEEDTHEVIDLHNSVRDGKIIWDTPEGNWTIQEYFCRTLPELDCINYLSYDACRIYINLTYKPFIDEYADYIEDGTVLMTLFSNICFDVPNRRMWDEHFNEAFLEQFGFDPAPYYPALYEDIGDITARMRAMFMNCRAKMFCEGFFRAVSEFTKAHGLLSSGHVAESQAIAAPWLYGDGMLYQKYLSSPGLALTRAYLYGINGLKLASGAACNFDRDLVTCEIYGGYTKLTPDILYRDAMNAFARGANVLIPASVWLSDNPRIPHNLTSDHEIIGGVLREFNDFAARCQTMLRGGKHVCNIALLYPIYSLQSQTTLYEAKVSEFEYPQTPVNADYMNDINIIINYCGHDLTVLHPETLHRSCYSENGVLHLSNNANSEQYQVLILPGCSMISLKSIRQIKKFYDGGGKIIATCQLPSRAFEFTPPLREDGLSAGGTVEEPYDTAADIEVRETVESIFGLKLKELNTFRSYYEHANENGGIACFIPTANTAADGTDLADAQTIGYLLDEKFGISHDVLIDNMPRIQNSGIFNLHYPLFANMNVRRTVGGIFNYIHRRMAGCDIYFFANSTNTIYDGKIAVRGEFKIVEEWNPHTGRIRRIPSDCLTKNGEIYTEFEQYLDSVSSTFIVCRG